MYIVRYIGSYVCIKIKKGEKHMNHGTRENSLLISPYNHKKNEKRMKDPNQQK